MDTTILELMLCRLSSNFTFVVMYRDIMGVDWTRMMDMGKETDVMDGLETQMEMATSMDDVVDLINIIMVVVSLRTK